MIFQCKFWAVVKVERNYTSDGSLHARDVFADVEGLWDDKTEAECWVAGQTPKIGPNAMDIKHKWDYTTEAYVIVPCADIKASCMSDIETKCEEAAKLQLAGIGVTA